MCDVVLSPAEAAAVVIGFLSLVSAAMCYKSATAASKPRRPQYKWLAIRFLLPVISVLILFCLRKTRHFDSAPSLSNQPSFPGVPYASAPHDDPPSARYSTAPNPPASVYHDSNTHQYVYQSLGSCQGCAPLPPPSPRPRAPGCTTYQRLRPRWLGLSGCSNAVCAAEWGCWCLRQLLNNLGLCLFARSPPCLPLSKHWQHVDRHRVKFRFGANPKPSSCSARRRPSCSSLCCLILLRQCHANADSASSLLPSPKSPCAGVFMRTFVYSNVVVHSVEQ